jgi:hypothetical protein
VEWEGGTNGERVEGRETAIGKKSVKSGNGLEGQSEVSAGKVVRRETENGKIGRRMEGKGQKGKKCGGEKELEKNEMELGRGWI